MTEFDQDLSVIGFPPPTEERPGPEGAEGDEVDLATATGVKSSSSTVAAAGPTEVTDATSVKAGEPLVKSERGDHDTEEESHDEEQCKLHSVCNYKRHFYKRQIRRLVENSEKL